MHQHTHTLVDTPPTAAAKLIRPKEKQQKKYNLVWLFIGQDVRDVLYQKGFTFLIIRTVKIIYSKINSKSITNLLENYFIFVKNKNVDSSINFNLTVACVHIYIHYAHAFVLLFCCCFWALLFLILFLAPPHNSSIFN